MVVAQSFLDEGAEWLHVVDLDGAKSGRPQHLGVLEKIALLGVSVQFGGGLRSANALQSALDAGASRGIVGTRLTQDEETASQLFEEFGERVVAGVDARAGKVAVHGWTADSGKEVVEFVRSLAAKGCRRIIYTDIGRDGELAGPDVEGTKRLLEPGIPMIASGGVSRLADIEDLARIGVEGVIIGKAFYEGRFSLRDARLMLQPGSSRGA